MSQGRRKSLSHRAGVTGVVVACVVALAAATVPAGATVKKQSSSTTPVTVGYDFTASTGMNFDPVNSVTGLNVYLQHLVMGGLFWNNQDGSLRPDLASGYKQVDDKTLEVTIRPNLKFSDGTPLTAENFKASVERLSQTRNNAIRPAYKNTSVIGGQLQSVVASSPTKLLLTFTAPVVGQAALMLAAVEGIPTHPSQITGANNLKAAPIGAGPYKIVSYTEGAQLELAPSPTYWDAKNVAIKNLKFVQNSIQGSGPTQGVNRTTTGEFDYFNAYYADTASVLAAGKGDIAAEVAPSNTLFTWFQVCKHPSGHHRRPGLGARGPERADGDEPDDRPRRLEQEHLRRVVGAAHAGLAQGSALLRRGGGQVVHVQREEGQGVHGQVGVPERLRVQRREQRDADHRPHLPVPAAAVGEDRHQDGDHPHLEHQRRLGPKGPAGMTNFPGIDSFRLTQRYPDPAANRHQGCGFGQLQPYVAGLQATPPSDVAGLKKVWRDVGRTVADTQSEIMLLWSLNADLYNKAKIKKVAKTTDGLGFEWIDPTRSTLK